MSLLHVLKHSTIRYFIRFSNEPQKGNTGVYFQSDNVEFTSTEVGQTSTVKIKICNKSTCEHQVIANFAIVGGRLPETISRTCWKYSANVNSVFSAT